MSNRRHPIRLALPIVGLALLTIAATGSTQGKEPSLGGTWKFNPEKTRAEAPKRLLGGDQVSERETMGGGGRPRVGAGTVAGGGAAGGGGEGRPGGGGAEGGGGGGRAGMGPLGLYARPLPVLQIQQTDSTITISDQRGTPRTYYIDGRKEQEPLPGGELLEIVAKLKDGKLTTERKMGSFGAVKEVYSVDPKSHDLTVEVRLTGPQLDKPIDSRRIYDAAPGS